MGARANMIPVINKTYCSSSQVVLVVRRRPHVTNGGGSVVTDCNQKVIFKVDGCGILGIKDELILRDGDGDGDALLLIRRKKGGMVEALSIYKKWKGYTFDYEGSQKLVFSLKEPNSCLVRNNAMKISTEPRVSNKDWDFTIKGYFPNRDCSIIDTKGDIVAQVGVKKEVQELMASKDLYHVVVKPGIDQAFVFGVIATLDYIYGESTRYPSSLSTQRTHIILGAPHKNARRTGANEALAITYPFDRRSSSTIGIVNRFGSINGNSSSARIFENVQLPHLKPTSIEATYFGDVVRHFESQTQAVRHI
ncbi:hypothetical protein ACJW30_07G005500 [Castanea mollissima]